MQLCECGFTISELSGIRDLFNLSCVRGVIGLPALVLSISALLLTIAVLVVILGYRRGNTTAVRIYGYFINKIFSIWPRWPYTHATVAIGIASVIAFLIFIPLTNELIVNVTAVYATILFLQESLRKEVPLLDIEFIRPTSTREYDTSIVEGDGDGDVVKQLIEVRNFGDLEADNIQLECRSINSQGEITSNWSTDKVSWEADNHLQPNSETKCEIYVDTVEEFDEQEYITEVKIKPNVRLGHLLVRKIQGTKAESE